MTKIGWSCAKKSLKVLMVSSDAMYRVILSVNIIIRTIHLPNSIGIKEGMRTYRTYWPS